MSYNEKENFIKFIEKHNIKDRVEELIYQRSNDDIYDYLHENSPASYIDRLAAWRNLEEGHEYWSNKNDEWKKILFTKTEVMPDKIKSIW